MSSGAAMEVGLKRVSNSEVKHSHFEKIAPYVV